MVAAGAAGERAITRVVRGGSLRLCKIDGNSICASKPPQLYNQYIILSTRWHTPDTAWYKAAAQRAKRR